LGKNSSGGRYVSAQALEDDGEQFLESARLEVEIRANLKWLGYEI
jgi:hypothetical protein